MSISHIASGEQRAAELAQSLDGAPGRPALEIPLREEARPDHEQILRDLDRRLAVTYEHATVGIAEVDAQGVRLRVNETACLITGRSREELVGGNIFDVLHPEDRDADLRNYRRLVAGEIDRYSIEKRLVRKDRSEIWASVTTAAVRDGAGTFLYAVRIFQDITEAKRVIDALAESEQRLSATYEHAAIAISEVDAQGRLLRVNETTCAITGYSREELLGLTIFDVTHPEDRTADVESFQQQASAGPARYIVEKRLIRKDGEVIWVSVASSTVRDAAGNFLYGIRVMQDITERRKAQEALRNSEATQRMLLAELNHRVKNNMQMLHSLLRAAQRETDSTEARRVLADASQRVGAMAAAQQVLYDGGHTVDFSAHDFLEAVCAGAKQALSGSVEVAIAESTTEKLPNDVAVPLALIVNELLTNAAKYGTTSNQASIRVALTKRGGRFLLSVEDDGPGFEFEEMRRRSSGLGLVVGLARQLGGTFRVERGPGARCLVEFDDRPQAH